MQQQGIKLFGRQSTVIFSHREKKKIYILRWFVILINLQNNLIKSVVVPILVYTAYTYINEAKRLKGNFIILIQEANEVKHLSSL